MHASNRSPADVGQIVYRRDQLSRVDPAFSPYDNVANERPDRHEYHVFLRERGRSTRDSDRCYGFVSWKFGMKTGVSGAEFLEFVGANPGMDVYFINPFHEYALTFRNVWEQGEYFHPGLTKAAEELFERLHLDLPIGSAVHGEGQAAFCNYFVATPRFWRRYLDVVESILTFADDHASDPLAIELRTPVPRHHSATMLTFVLERVLSSMIATGEWSAASYQFSGQWLRNRYGVLLQHLEPLRELKSAEARASLSESDRMVLAWYRRLFLQYKELEFDRNLLDKPMFRAILKLKQRLSNLW